MKRRRPSPRRQNEPDNPWAWLRSVHPEAADTLDGLVARQQVNDVDYARIVHALELAAPSPTALEAMALEIATVGEHTALHRSGHRDLPDARVAAHNLTHGQVRIGRSVPGRTKAAQFAADFGIDHDVLRTSLLVVGPPGSGKTRSFAVPIVEHLGLSALSGKASVVVVDPKGDDFAFPGWFDVTIDPLAPTAGFDLFGGAGEPEPAADRLASALLPPQVSDDLAYFMDASRNALYACLAPYHEAFGMWPTVRELLALLRLEQGTTDRVRAALKGPGSRDHKQLLDARAAQTRSSHDPSASMVERLALLDRPRLAKVFDNAEPKFRMHEINEPIRVRVALPEADLPDASRILARLVVSQFVQVCWSTLANRDIFKGLVVDEAGRFVDDYVARGAQRLRSTNAGLVLLTQTLGDFPQHVRSTVFGSTGCKAVFGGVDPADAEIFSQWFGDEWISDVTVSQNEHVTRSRTRGISYGDLDLRRRRGETESDGTGRGVSFRRKERARWSVSDIVTGIPAGHCIIALSRSSGERTGPVLVNLRA